jgi:hypothetical protein
MRPGTATDRNRGPRSIDAGRPVETYGRGIIAVDDCGSTYSTREATDCAPPPLPAATEQLGPVERGNLGILST